MMIHSETPRSNLLDWRCLGFIVLTWLGAAHQLAAAERVLSSRMHHLRFGESPEWADFPKRTDGPKLELRFTAAPNAGEWSLSLRQQDVRQNWRVVLNGKELGRLAADENDMAVHYVVPTGLLRTGANELKVEQVGTTVDDIRVGEIVLHDRPPKELLAEASVEVGVVDEQNAPLPCRLTVVNAAGALATTGARSGGQLAVRPGVIYTGDGRAKFGLPTGEYTIHAGRGFEYGLETVRLTARRGELVRKQLTLRREVATPGYVSSDPHVHTLTHSGHGDATLDERVITIAGEGIELPIATEHNKHIDYRAAAVRKNLHHYFTSLVGNEVTASVGHFNIFPVAADAPVPDVKVKDWRGLAAGIDRAAPKAVILNHGRDLHAGFRPLGPERFLPVTGERLDGWTLPANAIEVVNSGAQQSDVMRLVHDWLALLNRGLDITPVGSSDSHDVSRYIIGQGRTYIRARDDRVGAIDASEALESFRRGRVLVSCGLLVDIVVNERYGPGDLVPIDGDVNLTVSVLGPSWTTAERVELYANGIRVRQARISGGDKPGVKWQGTWTLPRPRHDIHLAAVATGPGVRGLHWPIARPYQPTSPADDRRVIGLTGAVWLDANGDGKKTSAFDFARRLFDAAGKDATRFIHSLALHDEAVARQAASVLQATGTSPRERGVREAAAKAGPHVERAFGAYAEAWRESQIARNAKR